MHLMQVAGTRSERSVDETIPFTLLRIGITYFQRGRRGLGARVRDIYMYLYAHWVELVVGGVSVDGVSVG